MVGGNHFGVICAADDPAVVLRRMADEDLWELLTTVGRPAGGIPALVRGMAEQEATTRWIEDQTPFMGGGVGEGSI